MVASDIDGEMTVGPGCMGPCFHVLVEVDASYVVSGCRLG